MNKRNFRTATKTEVKTGLAVWLDGRHFEDTNPIGSNNPDSAICGPFLVDRVLFFDKTSEPRIDLVDPVTGRRRSMMCSWLLVPKEK